ncbi:MAG: hypothetical protein MJK04_31440 [Psychrosphaera sp.]|nr:hypothetical protein [Psychrosphaera sp.]
MSIKTLITPLFTVVLVTSLPLEASENPFKTKPDKTSKLEKKLEEKDYPYGYTKAELRSVPRIKISGHTNPELIEEHLAWASFFGVFVGFYERDVENARYIYRRDIPSLAPNQVERFIDLAREALFEGNNIKQRSVADKRAMCGIIVDAAESGAKLSNVQIKKLLDEMDQKLPDHYNKVQENLKKELSPQVFKEMADIVNNKTRRGMSMSTLDIAGWTKLRAHAYTYSDVYEGIICPNYKR